MAKHAACAGAIEIIGAERGDSRKAGQREVVPCVARVLVTLDEIDDADVAAAETHNEGDGAGLARHCDH